MGIFALAILFAIVWTLLRAAARHFLQIQDDPPREEEVLPSDTVTGDPSSPYAPPRASLLPPVVRPPPARAGDPELPNRLGHALEDLGQNLPLGAQAAWRFGPPPPAAVLEPEEDAHRVSLSAEELARLSPALPGDPTD